MRSIRKQIIHQLGISAHKPLMLHRLVVQSAHLVRRLRQLARLADRVRVEADTLAVEAVEAVAVDAKPRIICLK